MKTEKFAFVSLVALLSTSIVQASTPESSSGIDFTHITPAHSAQEAYDRFETLTPLVVAQLASLPVGVFLNNGLGFTTVAIAKLAAGRDIDEINRVLLDPSTVAYAKTGTDFHDIFFCQRTGDYDFGLRGLVAMLYRFGDKPWLIYPETRQKIIDSLLSRKGNKVETTFTMGVCGRHGETENHILMTEGSRYLTNQVVAADQRLRGTANPAYDNELNGMNEWMLRHLQKFFAHDFYEYNSHPYQAYTVMAIENLAEFAEDARVKLAATMLMNYLDAKYTVSSNNLRRYVPFRRQPSYRTRTDLLQFDDEGMRMVQMSGATELFKELSTPYWYNIGEDRMLIAALGQYRTPALLLDLMLNREHAGYFQAFHHDGVEIYASSKNFLISGGGIHVAVWDFFSDQMNGWAMPTTLIPTHGGLDASQFVRFLGQKNDSDRSNTCVAPGFACGLNPVVPDFIAQDCRETQGGWTFLDFTSERCPLKYGFFAAVYAAPCDSKACKKVANSYGFLEAAEPSAGFDYSAFKSKVLASNGQAVFHSDQEDEYFASNGRRIRFLPLTGNKLSWGIRAIDGNPMVTDGNQWPLAFGDIVHADSRGKVEITNPYLRRKLTLDMTDPLNPARTETDY